MRKKGRKMQKECVFGSEDYNILKEEAIREMRNNAPYSDGGKLVSAISGSAGFYRRESRKRMILREIARRKKNSKEE